MSDWLIVLGHREGIEWVLRESKMAFRSGVDTSAVRGGDRFVLYTTRGAYGSPGTDQSQVLAFGRILSTVTDSPVEIGSQAYPRSCSIEVRVSLPPRDGSLFRPLIPDLGFIKKKESWWAYLHRTLIPLKARDFDLMVQAVQASARDQPEPPESL